MTIWDSICHSQWFKSTSIVCHYALTSDCVSSSPLSQILFLNKNDLFEAKVEHSDIKNFFPVRAIPLALASISLFIRIIVTGLRGPTSKCTGGSRVFQEAVCASSSKGWPIERARDLYTVCFLSLTVAVLSIMIASEVLLLRRTRLC